MKKILHLVKAATAVCTITLMTFGGSGTGGQAAAFFATCLVL